MKNYEQEINLYFELKGTPESSRESYLRRMEAFIRFIQNQNKWLDDIAETAIQHYILCLKKEKRSLPEPSITIFPVSAGSIPLS